MDQPDKPINPEPKNYLMKSRSVLHSSRVKAEPGICKRLVKDFVNGTYTDPELSPLIRNDPQLRAQCERWGYMIIQLGDQLRPVYCGTGQIQNPCPDCTYRCPNCDQLFNRDEFAQHMGGYMQDGNALRIDANTLRMPGGSVGVPSFGAIQSSPYESAPYGVDQRSGMSAWDNREYERNRMNESYKSLMKDRRFPPQSITKIVKGLAKQAPQQSFAPASGDTSGEHQIDEGFLLSLPIDQRLWWEVYMYWKEYGPVSMADISVELETRGKNPEYQQATETYAHANDEWLPEVLQDLVNRGMIVATPKLWGDKPGYIPGYNPDVSKHITTPNTDGTLQKHWLNPSTGRWEKTPGEGGEGAVRGAPATQEVGGVPRFKPGDTVMINAPGLSHHGEEGKVLYSRSPTSGERSYVIETKDGGKVLRLSSQVESKDTPPATPTTEVAAPKAPATPEAKPTEDKFKVGSTVYWTGLDGVSRKGTVFEDFGSYKRVQSDTGSTQTVASRRLSETPTQPGQPKSPIDNILDRLLGPKSPETGTESFKDPTTGEEIKYRWSPMFGPQEVGPTKHFWEAKAPMADPNAPDLGIKGVTITHWEPNTKATAKLNFGGAGRGVKLIDDRLGADNEKKLWSGDEVKNVPVTKEALQSALGSFHENELKDLRIDIGKGNIRDLENRAEKQISEFKHARVSNKTGHASGELGGGFYLSETHTFYMGRQTEYGPDHGDVTGVMRHEISHHVYENALSSGERYDLSEQYYKHHDQFKEHVSGYGYERGPEEGFAEFSKKARSPGGADYLKEHMPEYWEIYDKAIKRVESGKEGPKADTSRGIRIV